MTKNISEVVKKIWDYVAMKDLPREKGQSDKIPMTVEATNHDFALRVGGFLARGECTNCGYENYPAWGMYDFGRALTDYPCPKCECMTWRPRTRLDDIESSATPTL